MESRNALGWNSETDLTPRPEASLPASLDLLVFEFSLMKLLFGALKSHIPALIPPGMLLHAPPGPDLGTELVELAALVAGDDELAERAPHGAGDLGIAAGNLHVGLVVL